MKEKMSSAELSKHVEEFLSEHNEGALATVYNNIPRCSPVQYFLGDHLNVYIVSAGGEKFKAIEQNPNVCLLVNTDYINYRRIKGVQLFGTAITSIKDPSIFDEAMMYSPDPYILEKERNSVKIIKIVPKEIVYLNSLKEGDRTKQILRENQVIVKEDQVTLQ